MRVAALRDGLDVSDCGKTDPHDFPAFVSGYQRFAYLRYVALLLVRDQRENLKYETSQTQSLPHTNEH